MLVGHKNKESITGKSLQICTHSSCYSTKANSIFKKLAILGGPSERFYLLLWPITVYPILHAHMIDE